MAKQERPLVTFALFGYNQEQFIREAIEGAFSQIYSPLEIILSDDCSSDQTFEIMQERAASYRGPHKIILNKNKKNLGISGHVNRVMEMANGEIIVGAAGDDISLAQRTARTIHEFMKDSQCMSVYSALKVFGEAKGGYPEVLESKNGTFKNNLCDSIANYCPGILGASHAWHRSLFDYFGPLDSRISEEDRVLPLRAALLGKICYINESLVEYRVHGKNISVLRPNTMQDFNEYFIRRYQCYLSALKNYSKDLSKYQRRNIDESDFLKKPRKIIKEEIHKCLVRLKFFKEKSFLLRVKIILYWLLNGWGFSEAIRFSFMVFFKNFWLAYRKKIQK